MMTNDEIVYALIARHLGVVRAWKYAHNDFDERAAWFLQGELYGKAKAYESMTKLKVRFDGLEDEQTMTIKEGRKVRWPLMDADATAAILQAYEAWYLKEPEQPEDDEPPFEDDEEPEEEPEEELEDDAEA